MDIPRDALTSDGEDEDKDDHSDAGETRIGHGGYSSLATYG